MRVLEWDSAFFGFPIARIEPAAIGAAEFESWRTQFDIRCAYLLIGAADHASARTAAENGFRAVAVRVTLTAGEEEKGSGPHSRPAPGMIGARSRQCAAGDVDALKAIARSSHYDSRFYADGQFDRARCDDLFAHWIERSCGGWADRVFVFDHDGRAAGYVTVHRHGDAAQIGLVGVHERARGRGAASALVAEARRWCDAEGLRPLTVVTQGGNAAALALYQAAGFDVTTVALWYHRWFPTS